MPFIRVKHSCQNATAHRLKCKYNSKINTHFCTASIPYRNVMDRRTDGQTDRQTYINTARQHCCTDAQ